MKNKKTDFVFSSRNPIATVSPNIYAVVLVEEEDFEKSYLKQLYLEVSESFENNLRRQMKISSMYE